MTDSFYIYFSVDTKKDPKKFLYMLITCENVNMRMYYSIHMQSSKSNKDLRDAN